MESQGETEREREEGWRNTGKEGEGREGGERRRRVGEETPERCCSIVILHGDRTQLWMDMLYASVSRTHPCAVRMLPDGCPAGDALTGHWQMMGESFLLGDGEPVRLPPVREEGDGVLPVSKDE